MNDEIYIVWQNFRADFTDFHRVTPLPLAPSLIPMHLPTQPGSILSHHMYSATVKQKWALQFVNFSSSSFAILLIG